MFDVGVVHGSPELHFNCDDPPVGTFHDEVDFPFPTECSEVAYAGLGGLGVHPDGERHE